MLSGTTSYAAWPTNCGDKGYKKDNLFFDMMTFHEFWQPLTAVYDEGEARAVARLVLEVRFGLTMADVLCGRMPSDEELQGIQRHLLNGEPVQYVLGEAEFGGRRFRVSTDVLIPRPETYELCQWCLSSVPAGWQGRVLDVGTGSGCIACTLAAELPQAAVVAWDISEAALDVACENAKSTNVNVSFEQVDVLHIPSSAYCEKWDIIVSNPPYICEQEKAALERNVLEHEPHTALFVPDDDPLLFYRAISDYAWQTLKPGGMLYFEINPLYDEELEQLLCSRGFAAVGSRQDQFGKTRFTKATRL